MKPKNKLLFAISLAASFPITLLAQEPAATTNAVAVTRENAGYAIGLNLGSNLTNNLKRANFDVDTDQILAGIHDVLAGRELKMSLDQAGALIRTYQQQRTHELSEQNEKAGAAFLAENKTKEGVKTQAITLPDGKSAEFQYKVITEGKGDKPSPTDTVKVNYSGTLINGTEFDSSAKHGGQPVSFRVGGVIRGWSEALQMMPVGSKWQLFIPASLAYGDRGTPGIQPGATLIFDIELLEIVKPSEPTTPQPKPLTSEIIRVPSAEELKRGVKPEYIKESDLEKSNAMQNATSKTNK